MPPIFDDDDRCGFKKMVNDSYAKIMTSSQLMCDVMLHVMGLDYSWLP